MDKTCANMDFNSAPNFSSFPPGSFQQIPSPHAQAFTSAPQVPFAAHQHVAPSSSPSPYQSLDPHARFQQQQQHAQMAANFPSSGMNMSMAANSQMPPPGMAQQQQFRGEWLPIHQSYAPMNANMSLIYVR